MCHLNSLQNAFVSLSDKTQLKKQKKTFLLISIIYNWAVSHNLSSLNRPVLMTISQLKNL